MYARGTQSSSSNDTSDDDMITNTDFDENDKDEQQDDDKDEQDERSSPVSFDPSSTSYCKCALKHYKRKAVQNTANQQRISSTTTSDVPINTTALEQDSQLSPDDITMTIKTLKMIPECLKSFSQKFKKIFYMTINLLIC